MLSDVDSHAKKKDVGLVSNVDLHLDLSEIIILTGPSKSLFIYFKSIFKRCGYNV